MARKPEDVGEVYRLTDVGSMVIFLGRIGIKLGPQKITLFSSNFDSPLRTASFQDLDAARQNINDLLADSQPPDATWWLDIENPSEESLYDLCNTFRLHPLTAEDIWRREKRDKFEDFRSYSFVCIQTFRAADGQALPSVVPYTIYVILLPGCTLSFRFTEGEHTTRVLQRIDLLRDHVTINSDWICYALIDDIVDSFTKPISIIERNVSRIDDEIYTTRIDDMSTFLGEIDSERKAIASLIALLSHKSDLLSAFQKHRCELQLANLSETESISSRNSGLMLYISDIQDHLATNLSSLAQFESLLARSQESYLAQLSIGNVSGRQRTHIFLKRMGLLTLILALINWLFSMFGMNVNANVTMFAESTLTRYWIIIGVSVFVSVIILAWARRYRFF
ncbi:hypothetical protein OIDMADRAFT_99401 [Oidiodendron maius Zn]|uniref:Magnesium transporter n=1 Tax=Oidiodendron maius (strain Zn) TaxID=913774 RepID=A0A0C3HVQ4_OIDMZ|nr:hypothetical protein OIDMADRAFT_99401 [Oidiodendron maius Zn]